MTAGRTTDSKSVALDRLRQWRTVFEQRDDLVRNAAAAGATNVEICAASQLAKNTVRAALNLSEEPMTTTTEVHHPHYISHTEQNGRRTYTFRQFTGDEPNPWDWFNDQPSWSDDLRDEVNTVWPYWRDAHIKVRGAKLLGPLAKQWETCSGHVDALSTAFDKLYDTPKDLWPGQLMRLTDARSAALKAAAEWDTAIVPFMQLVTKFDGYAGQIAELCGYDISGWSWDSLDCYSPDPGAWGRTLDTPLVQELKDKIVEQDTKIAAAMRYSQHED